MGGVQRGSQVLKALSLGAKAVGVGRYYLFPLAAAGQAGVERALELMRAELLRDEGKIDDAKAALREAVCLSVDYTFAVDEWMALCTTAAQRRGPTCAPNTSNGRK